VPTVDENAIHENTLRTLLRGVADVEVPPPAVNLDLAIAGGRRQRRRRVAAAASSALAVVAAVSVFVATIVAANPRATVTPQTRATASPSATASAVHMPASAPARFNPLVPYAAFGWLPDGYALYAGTAQAVTTRSIQLVAAPANGSGQILLTVDAKGACTGSVPTSLTCAGTNGSTLRMRSFSAAPAVNGRPAYWAADKYVGGYLVWQYAPGAWASLDVTGPGAAQAPPAAQRPTLRQVAAQVRYGAGTPIAFPFWLRLPAGWTAGGSFFSQGSSGALLGRLTVGPPGDPQAADLNVGTPVPGNCPGTPDTTLDGAPAVLAEPGHSPVYQAVCAENVDGLGVYVSLDLKPDGQPLLDGGALGLAERLHLLGARVSAWTTRPLR
jgi:hypothetical protein